MYCQDTESACLHTYCITKALNLLRVSMHTMHAQKHLIKLVYCVNQQF